ncbi:MAG TPA: DUF937 domain-containing protein [Pyrinomonadaceae bacterium]|nr:DUF937 domain-containing protein [Pyrinomonadaceae bacterium]
MFSLQDLLGQQQGNEALEQISGQVGAEPSLVNTAIQAALPAILGGLANNASTPQGAESLDAALSNDHSGGILGNLGGLGSLIFDQSTPTPREADAGGILGHILGGSQNQVAQDVSQKSGLGMGQVAQILMMLAPIVMGYLGQQKQQQNVGADGLGGLLGGLLGGALGGGQAAAAPSSGNPMLDMASSMLDSDRDGSSLDDIASMAFNYITKK